MTRRQIYRLAGRTLRIEVYYAIDAVIVAFAFLAAFRAVQGQSFVLLSFAVVLLSVTRNLQMALNMPWLLLSSAFWGALVSIGASFVAEMPAIGIAAFVGAAVFYPGFPK